MKVILAAGWGYPFKIHATNIKSEFIGRGVIAAGGDVLFLDALWGTANVKKNTFGISDTGIRYVSLPRTHGALSVFPNFFRVIKILKKEKQKDEPNVFISMFSFPIVPMEWLICKIAGYKKCMLYHEWYQCLGNKSITSRIQGWLGDNFIPKYMDAIHPISHFILNHCRKFNKPMFSIPVLSDYSDDACCKIEDMFTYCASAGYLLRNTMVLEAFSKIKVCYPGLKLTLVLNQIGNSMPEVEALLESYNLNNSAIIKSNLSQADLYDTFRRSIGLLIPLDPDNIQDKARFSQKIAEYVAMKRPIITSNAGEIPYFFKDKDNAIIVEYDSESYAKALAYLYENKQEASRIGKNGFYTGVNYFHYKKVGAELVKFYAQTFGYANIK